MAVPSSSTSSQESIQRVAQHFNSSGESGSSPIKLVLEGGTEFDVVKEGGRFGVKDLFTSGKVWFLGDDFESADAEGEKGEAVIALSRIILGEEGIPCQYTASHLNETPVIGAVHLFFKMDDTFGAEKALQTLPLIDERTLASLLSNSSRDQIEKYAPKLTAAQLKGILLAEPKATKFATVMSYADSEALGIALSQIDSKDDCCKCFKQLPLEVKIKLVQGELCSAPQNVKKFVVNAADVIVTQELQAEITVDEAAIFCNVLVMEGGEELNRCSVQVIDMIAKSKSLPTDSKVSFVMALSPESIKANEALVVELMCKPEVRCDIWGSRPLEIIAEKLSVLSEDSIRGFCEGDAASGELDKNKAECLITFEHGAKILVEYYCDEPDRWEASTSGFNNEQKFTIASKAEDGALTVEEFIQGKTAQQLAEGLVVIARNCPRQNHAWFKAMNNSKGQEFKAELAKLPAKDLSAVVLLLTDPAKVIKLIPSIEAESLSALLIEVKTANPEASLAMVKAIAKEPSQAYKLAACSAEYFQETYEQLEATEKALLLENLSKEEGKLQECWSKLTPQQQRTEAQHCTPAVLEILVKSASPQQLTDLLEGMHVAGSNQFPLVCGKLTTAQLIDIQGLIDFDIAPQVMVQIFEHGTQQCVARFLMAPNVAIRGFIGGLAEPHLSEVVGLLETRFPNELTHIISRSENADFLTGLPIGKLMRLVKLVGDEQANRKILKTNTTKLGESIARAPADGRAVYHMFGTPGQADIIRGMLSKPDSVKAFLQDFDEEQLIRLFAAFPNNKASYLFLESLCLAIPSQKVISVLVASDKMGLMTDSWRLGGEGDPGKFLLEPSDMLLFELQDMQLRGHNRTYSEQQLREDLSIVLFSEGKDICKEALDLLPIPVLVTAVEMSAGESEWCKQYVKNGQVSAERFEELCKGLASNQDLVAKLCEERGITRDLSYSGREQMALQLSLASLPSSHSTGSSPTQSSSPEQSPTQERSPIQGRPSMPRSEGATAFGSTAKNIVDAEKLIEEDRVKEASTLFAASAKIDQAIILSKLMAQNGKDCRPEIAKQLLSKLNVEDQKSVLLSMKATHVRKGFQIERFSLNQILLANDDDVVTGYIWNSDPSLIAEAQFLFGEKWDSAMLASFNV